MSNSEYWIKTALIREIQMQKKCTQTISEIEKLYNNVICDINAEITKIFEKFKNCGSVTTEEARELINSDKNEKTLKRLQQTLKQTENKKQRSEILKKIYAQAYGARISRLEAVKINVYCYFKEKANIEIKKTETFYGTIIEENYYKTIHDIAKGCNVGINFSLVPQKAVDEILSSKWHDSQFSDKVWKNTSLAAEKAQEIIERGLLSHKSYNIMADELAKICENTKYNARRLIRTQASHFLNLSEFKAYEDLGIEKYKYLATLDGKTCELCQPLDGKIFSVSEKIEGVNCPTMHPHCRCTTTLPTEYAKRWAKDPINGRNYKVNDMSYSKWIESLDDKQKAAFEKNVKMYKNRSRDKKQYTEYIKILGKENVPKTFDLFQNLKYNDVERWELLKDYKNSRSSNMISAFTSFKDYERYKQKINEELIGLTTIDGVKIKHQSKHFIERVFGTSKDLRNGKPRDGVEIDEIKEALINGEIRKKVYSTKYKTDVCEVAVNPKTGMLIQTNPQ